MTKTGEIFRFATPEETPAKMHDLMDWLREKQVNSDIEPVLLAAEFHYRFIRIHPFDDGNGRTARLLMNFILMQYGYPPVIIKTEDKQNYFNVLRLADAGNIEPFVNYIAENLSRSLEIMIKGAKGENIEDPDDLDKEIALLEQKLKGVGQKIEKTKSKESILEFYNKSYLRLSVAYQKAGNKFDKFYDSIQFSEKIGVSEINYEEIDFLIEEHGLDIISDFNLYYFFYSFMNLSPSEFDFISSINIQFKPTTYLINLRFSKDKYLLKKNYTEQLTDEEINLIVNTEMKRHTAFIEDKIKEIQAH